jgi:hypothetical protein
MSDDKKQYEATPAATLEQRVMDPRIEKSETGWWAHREIKRLRDEVEHWEQARAEALAGGDVLRAEIERLRARVDSLREPLAVYVHAHQTGNSVPPHIEAAARAALEAKP